MHRRRQALTTLLAGLPLGAAAQSATTPAPAPATESPLFAWELRTGPAWDAAKPPQEQQHFKEHSVNLRRLRDEGRLVAGARYSDKGFILLSAANIDEARAVVESDPAIRDKVFVYELHAFNVFYGGCMQPRRR